MSRNIKILLSASILIHVGTNLLAPIYAVFLKNIGGNLLETGISVGIYAIIRGILYFLFSKIDENKVSKKLMMVTGYTVMGIGYIGYLEAFEPWHVFIIQAIISIGESAITPSWSAMIAVSLKKGRERNIYSNFYGFRSMFEGVAAIIGGLFAMQMGFNTVFIVMTCMALGSAVLSFFVNEKKPDQA